MLFNLVIKHSPVSVLAGLLSVSEKNEDKISKQQGRTRGNNYLNFLVCANMAQVILNLFWLLR